MFTYRDSSPTLAQTAVQLLPLALALPYAVALQPWRSRSFEALWPLWLAFAAIGVSASGHAYPHYLIQLVPPLSLVLVTWAVRRPVLPRVSVAMGMVVGVLAVYQIFLGPWGYVAWNQEPQHTRAYYRNFVDYMDGDRSRQDYEAFFDPQDAGPPAPRRPGRRTSTCSRDSCSSGATCRGSISRQTSRR